MQLQGPESENSSEDRLGRKERQAQKEWGVLVPPPCAVISVSS